jgi:hypothetical protein
MKMKTMSGTVYNLLECSLRTTQYVTVLVGFVESSALTTLDQHSTRLEEETEEEVAECKATFLDALKGLEVARKYMCQYGTENNVIVMCNRVKK